jgi:hypothetical protein
MKEGLLNGMAMVCLLTGMMAPDERTRGIREACLKIHDVNEADAGSYSVAIELGERTLVSGPAELWVGPLTRFVGTTILPSGLLKVDFTGEPGRLYNVEASVDMEQWTFITNFFAGQGSIRIIDWQSTNYARRYYRAVSP